MLTGSLLPLSFHRKRLGASDVTSGAKASLAAAANAGAGSAITSAAAVIAENHRVDRCAISIRP